MAVRAIGTYDFPSSSRAELYGDDQLVHVWWKQNLWMCAASCFRAPKAMPWGAFLAEIVHPVFACDPDFDPATTRFTWELDGRAIEPADDVSLADLGVEHKSLLAATLVA